MQHENGCRNRLSKLKSGLLGGGDGDDERTSEESEACPKVKNDAGEVVFLFLKRDFLTRDTFEALSPAGWGGTRRLRGRSSDAA